MDRITRPRDLDVRDTTKRAFTLIEPLVVLAIIAILAPRLLPAPSEGHENVEMSG